jgi:phosphoglycolate phosphatase
MINISQYTHIIWDWNGTLLDDVDLCIRIINRILEKRCLPKITRASYLEAFGFPVRDYYQRIGFTFDIESFEIISTEFITAYEAERPGCQLMPGARVSLEGLSSRGYTQSILSASKRSSLEQAVIDYGIEFYFNSLQGLDNHHAAGKIEIAKQCLSNLTVNPKDILLIGDTTHDAEIAQMLDIDCWLIPQGHQSRHRLVAAGVPVFNSLFDLSNILNGNSSPD